ncbi:efflux RND transporter permease subunit, partial [Rhodopirellula bahusiensis]
AALTMPRREDPEFTLKICVVSARWPGASAEKMEELVTDPLEEAIDGIEEVRLIRSTSSSEQTVIFVELEEWLPGAKIDDAWDRVRARVENVPMPDPVVVPFVNDEFADTSVILFAVHQQPDEETNSIDPRFAYSDRELDIYSERIRDALRLLPGVAKVERHGVREEAIYVETDERNWSQLELTIDQIAALAKAQNIVEPGGRIDAGDGRFFVKPAGEVNALAEINRLVVSGVPSRGGVNPIHLEDMGLRVRRGYVDPPTRICRYGDVDFEATANVVAVQMKSGANIVDICSSAKQRIVELRNSGALPPDLAVPIISDQSDSVNQRLREVVFNIISAIVIVVVVVYLVVGFRTAAVMAANIPFVVLTSLAIVTLFGVQLEQMSLASMIISLGLLVDNAVQICDQARTNQIAGMPPKEAAVHGAQTLGKSMLNGTLTTIAAFVPMLIAMDGVNREFIYSLPTTLSVMLAVSWVLAMTFCVILAAWFIRPPKDPSKPTAPLPWLMAKIGSSKLASRFGRQPSVATDSAGQPIGQTAGSNQVAEANGFFFRVYGSSLRWALKHRFVTMAGAFGVLLATTQLPISAEFFPLTQRNQFAVEVWLPESSSIAQTNEVARQVEDVIRRCSSFTNEEGEQDDRLLNMRTMVGGGGARWYLSWEPEALKPNFAEILIQTTDGRRTHDFAEELRRVITHGDEDLGLQPIVGAQAVPIELFLGPPADPVVLRVVGNGFANMKTLRDSANRIKKMVDSDPDTISLNDSWGVSSQELYVDVESDRANLARVSNAEVASTLDTYFSGRLLTYYREGEHQVPVYFRLEPESRSLSAIANAHVETSQGKLPLASIATVIPQWRPALIDRRDGNRTIEVRSQVKFGASGNDITMGVFNSPEMKELQGELPDGFKVEVGGALEESQKAQWKMLKSFGMSFVAIIILLIVQFNSLFRTSIIIATLPLALAGALIGLWLTNSAFGFMPQLGVLALFGIVLNAAILFVEFADMSVAERNANDSDDADASNAFDQAIVAAGQQRLTAIFLTTATTVGGLIPLALDGGPLWEGMAWLLVSGLSFATLLTLIVVPVLYSFGRRFAVPGETVEA